MDTVLGENTRVIVVKIFGKMICLIFNLVVSTAPIDV